MPIKFSQTGKLAKHDAMRNCIASCCFMNGKLTDIGQWDWSGWLFGVDCLLIVLCTNSDICLDLFASAEEPS